LRTCLSLLALLLLPGLVLVPSSGAVQDDKREKSGYEKFEEVDPYTEGEREKLDALGYVRYGPFPWHGAMRTVELREVLGGMDTLFVETEHFLIASTLQSYPVPNDKPERTRLAAERKRLEERLGRLKASKKELDPWMRLHVYALRLEDTLATFTTDFGLDGIPLEEGEFFPGQKAKFRVLLCETRSEFQRYLTDALGIESDEYYWGVYQDGSIFFGANIEGIRERWARHQDIALDTQLYGHVLSGAIAGMLGGYRDSFYGVPMWAMYGLAHHYARQMETRYVTANGQSSTKEWNKEDGEWYRRVYGLVNAEFFASCEDMFGWLSYTDLNERDHLITWSRIEFLMQLDGDRKRFLNLLCQRPPTGSEEERRAVLAARSREALREAFGMEPEEFEAAWVAHVLKEYKRKK
jgi:hypothetical protein